MLSTQSIPPAKRVLLYPREDGPAALPAMIAAATWLRERGVVVCVPDYVPRLDAGATVSRERSWHVAGVKAQGADRLPGFSALDCRELGLRDATKAGLGLVERSAHECELGLGELDHRREIGPRLEQEPVACAQELELRAGFVERPALELEVSEVERHAGEIEGAAALGVDQRSLGAVIGGLGFIELTELDEHPSSLQMGADEA